MKLSVKKIILLFLQGALVGTGAILPGVSGGVLAASFGIYEPMMEFLAHPIKTFKKNIALLFPAVIGGGVGFILLAGAVKTLLEKSPIAALSLFCGLICGTVPGLAKKSRTDEKKAYRDWSGFILALVIAYSFFSFLQDGTAISITPNFWWYIFCGAVWGLSMVVPGLSSSSILLFIGLYYPMTDGISRLDFKVLVPLLIGFAVTIILLARPVDFMLVRHHSLSTKMILAFVIASVIVIMPPIPSAAADVAVMLSCFAAGFAFSLIMSRMEE